MAEQPAPQTPAGVGPMIGLGLVGGYALLMTLQAGELLLLSWAALASGLAIASLAGGLTVLAAIGPFTEAVTDDGRITVIPFLLAALGLGVLVALGRRALAGELARPPLAIALAALLFVGTLAAVGLSAISFGGPGGIEALQLWVPGIGGGLTVLFAAWLVGGVGEYRPLVVLVAAITLAATLSLADWLLGGIVQQSAAGWLLRPDPGPERLTGVIPAPNAAAAIFLVGLAAAASAVFAVRRPWLPLVAAAAAAVLLVALVLTASRSGLLALVVIAAVLGWRLVGWRALVLLAVLAAAVLLAAALIPGMALIRDVPFWADEARLAAWAAAGQMWLDSPLIGHGLRSFEWLHAQYGSTLDAPHNEWLRFFAEGGVVVGVVALAFAGAALLALLRSSSWLAAAGAAALGAMVLMASFNNPFLYVQVNVPLFLLAGLALGARHASTMEPTAP